MVRVSKSNFRYPEHGISFTIGNDEELECGFVTGLDRSNITAEALAAGSVPPEERTERDEAREFVKSVLKDGPMESRQFMRLAAEAGISERTVKRARRDLNVKAAQVRDGNTIKGWRLELPNQEGHLEGHDPTLGPLGPLGTLAPNRGNGSSLCIKGANSANSAKESNGSQPFYERDEF